MNVMKKNKLAGKFSLLHRLNTDTVIIGLLPGINVNELTSTDLRYLAAFYLGGAVYVYSLTVRKKALLQHIVMGMNSRMMPN